MDHAGNTLFIGIVATLTMDLWTFLRSRLLGTPPADYGLVGRWLAYMVHGRFRHEHIAAVPPVPGEKVVGWVAHYLTGIAFAGLLLAMCGPGWGRQPTPAPALVFGVVTVAAPFLLMQPGMGAGIAASRTPRPNAARVQSIVTHAIFGAGLYVAALVHNLLMGV